ncbi:MAG: tetratricopeptide repeat-containing sensor histidine kinase [Bacteroidetes bacterium]|nr:tetratricopeptide repeat-containing sensor histidine kinase [Bacteroidota bacterium]
MKTNNISRLLPIIILVMLCVAAFPANNPDSLRKVYQQAKPSEKRLLALNLARALIPDSMETAKEILHHAGKELSQMKPAEKAEYYNVQALWYWFSRNYDSAVNFAIRTTLLDTTAVPAQLRAEALNNAGTLHNILGNLDSSIHYAKLALKLDEQRNNKVGMAKSHYDLAARYRKLGHFELAARHGIQSVKLHEEIGNNERLFHSLNALGNIFIDLEDTANALKTFYKAIDVANQIGKPRLIALVHNNISGAMIEFNKPRNAYSHAKEAIRIAEENKIDEFLFQSYLNAAKSGAALGFKKEAETYVLKAFQQQPARYKLDYSEGYLIKSQLMLDWGQTDSADFYAKHALMLARENEQKNPMYKTLLLQSKIDSIKGNHYEALKNYKLAIDLKDKILSNQHKSRIEELMLVYETEKMEAENSHLASLNLFKNKVILNQKIVIVIIVLLLLFAVYLMWKLNSMRLVLKHQNEVISRSNDQLTELNKTKDKFLSVIAHDLKGPFNALLGLLDILTNEYHSVTDEERLELLKSLEKTSQNTYALLVNLLDWAKGQREGFKFNPSQFEVSSAVQEVFEVLQYRAKQKQHKLINAVPENSQCFFDRNVMISVLINLVNNSIKFTPHGGTISVTWHTNDDGKHVICVEDNGIGIPADKIERLFELDNQLKRKGTDQESGTGLGLVLVKEFLEVGGAHISVQSTEGKGSRFCIILP